MKAITFFGSSQLKLGGLVLGGELGSRHDKKNKLKSF